MKMLERILLSTLFLQTITYVVGLVISYNATHNRGGDILESLLPFALFGLLCVVNLILFINYVIYIKKVRKQINKLLLVLFILNLLFVLGYNYIIHLVNTSSGSSLPGY